MVKVLSPVALVHLFLSEVEWSPWGACSGLNAGLNAGPDFCGEREVEGRQFRTSECVSPGECGGGTEDGIEAVESRPCTVVVRGPPCEEEEEEVQEVTQEDVRKMRDSSQHKQSHHKDRRKDSSNRTEQKKTEPAIVWRGEEMHLRTNAVPSSVFSCNSPSSTCLNGGRCEGVGRCHCRGGWEGRRCERAACRPGGCLNGGRCIEPDVCQCQEGYTGARCQRGEENDEFGIYDDGVDVQFHPLPHFSLLPPRLSKRRYLLRPVQVLLPVGDWRGVLPRA